MRAPFLSIVVPAFNEEARIAITIAQVLAEVERLAVDAELIIVDDGSTDRTASIAEESARGDARLTALRAAHAGKGATVRRGMLAARGAWRFLADADLSMPISELERFLATARNPGADIVVGSREANGARRVGEPWLRHAIGRVFNYAVKVLVLRGIDDTQCGFKLFSAEAAEVLFPLQRLDGFGFDVELLFLARRSGFVIREIPVTWIYGRESKVNLASGARGFLDLVAVRWHQLRGAYPPRASMVRAARSRAGTASSR
jgi:glycosyltransferase involved in cell wall biosynthesis